MLKQLRSIIVTVAIMNLPSFCFCNLIQEDTEMITFAKTANQLMLKVVGEFKVMKVINYGNSKELDDEMNEIIRSSDGELIFEVLKKVPNGTFNCFMMFDSLADYDKVFKFSKNPTEMKIVINYIRNTTIDEISLKVPAIWKTICIFMESCKFYRQNVYILHRNSSGFIDLIATNRFIDDSLMWMTTVNRFSIEQQEWKPPMKELKLIDNFQGSNIILHSTEINDGLAVGPSKHKFSHKQDDGILSGYMIEIIHELEKIGNFKTNYDEIKDFEQLSNKHNNLILLTKPIQLEMINLEDAMLDYFSNRFQTSLIFKELYFTIPPAERFTEWEILFLAFDVATWSMILLTLLVAFIAVAIIGFTSQSVNNFVFGENVSSPSLNILAAFLGIPQAILPKRSFARFLLMAFIMWSLLIRTCYVGVLFEYLKGDGRKAPIKSIDEMLDRNFTYFIFLSHCAQMVNMEFHGR